MKNIFKKIFTIIFTLTIVFTNINILKAASATISVSTSTSKLVVGNTFTATVKISGSNLGSWEWTLNYDKSKFKLISRETNVANVFGQAQSVTYKFKAIATGSGTITVKSYNAISMDKKKMSVSAGSKTVKVITQSELQASYSKNNYLKSLSVSNLTLSPSFDKSKTEYRAEAESNTEEVTIKATADDSKSSVSGTGVYKVSEGENKFKISVTSESGSTKTYTLIVNVIDPNPIKVTVNNKELTLIKRESLLEAPNGFEKTTVEIENQKIPAFQNEVNNFILVGLKDENGDAKLYIYNKEEKKYSLYTEITLNQIKLYPLPIDKTFDEIYEKSTTTINDIEFESLKIKNSEYSIINAKDLLTGIDNYYLYDSITNSVIRYTDENTKSLKEKLNDNKQLIIILGAESIAIIFVLMCILISRVTNNKRKKKEYLKRLKKIEESKKQKEDIKEQEKINEQEEVIEEKNEQEEINETDEVQEEINETKKKKKNRKKKK